MNTYFLTGASGAVGSAIVPILLALPDTRVRILIRATSESHLQERFETLCGFWKLSSDDPRRLRIEALRGDAAEPQFGLDESVYETLSRDCTHIIHCAATVRMNESLDDARHSALGSAQQILALGRACADAGSLKKIEFVSTVGVAGKRDGALPERWIDEPREFHNTYEQSKAEAEALIHDAIEKDGLPLTVHRPSMVIGDSRDGRIIHFQIFYFICEFLSGRRTGGLYPDFGETRLDVIPVDCVANAIVDASRNGATAGRIFHLCSGPDRAPRLHELKTVVREAFARHHAASTMNLTLPRSVFAWLPRLAAFLAPPSKRKALATLPIYLDYLADRQGFDNPYFLAWFQENGHQLPQWNAYLPRILEQYLAKDTRR